MTLDQWHALFGSEEAYVRAVEHIASEYLDLACAAVDLSADTPQAEDINNHALIAATFNSPDCDPAWRRLATYMLTALDPSEELTPEQERIRAIAASVYATETAVAGDLGINLYPKDSEDALERALVELAPYLKDKETVQ